VIRGPGATVWGANAVDGVISVITKKASDTQGGMLTQGVGTSDQAGGIARYGGSLAATLRIASLPMGLLTTTFPTWRAAMATMSGTSSRGVFVSMPMPRLRTQSRWRAMPTVEMRERWSVPWSPFFRR